MDIHPTAIISKKAKLGKDAQVGPYVIIEDDVAIGQGVKIYAGAHISEHTTIGDDCQIHMGAILGHLPQMYQIPSKEGRLVIGPRNIFREYATVHRSSRKGEATVIGEDNYLMGFSHIAHDCSIGSHVTICNGTLLAGHVKVEDYAFISGNVTVHQFCRIGKLSMVGGLTRVAKDLPPYMLAKGDSMVWAINSVGLRRANFSRQARSEIKTAFKLLYKSGLNVRQAIKQLQKDSRSSEIEYLINFILHTQRGICGYKKPAFWERIRLSNPTISHRQIPAYQLFQNSRKGQQPLAIAIAFVLIILLLVCLKRPLRQKLQDTYHYLIREMQYSLSR